MLGINPLAPGSGEIEGAGKVVRGCAKGAMAVVLYQLAWK